MKKLIIMALLVAPVAATAQTKAIVDLGTISATLAEQKAAAAVTNGVVDAENDFTNGIHRIKVWGLGRRGEGNSPEEQYLKVLYGVTYERVAGCMVLPDRKAYYDSYNGRMKSLLEQRYGTNIFDALQRKAAEWKLRLGAQPSTAPYSEPAARSPQR